MHAALIVALAALLTLSGCRRAAPRESEPEPAVPVIVEPVKLGNIRGTVSATGVVATLPGAMFSVVATQPARIAQITKVVGDTVKSGETLVRFEFPSLRAQRSVNDAAMKSAALRVQQAQLTQGRIRMLVGKALHLAANKMTRIAISPRLRRSSRSRKQRSPLSTRKAAARLFARRSMGR